MVKLHISQNKDEDVTWDNYVRYSIDVSDIKDGESKYGEINSNEVLLEIEFVPSSNEENILELLKMSRKEPDHKGLSLIKKSTCFGCHADKTVLAGPSFSNIADRYEITPDNIKSLARHILEGSSGEWGSMVMPSHPDFTVTETEQIAEYVLTEGGMKNKWVLPGLEGTFRTLKKPDTLTKGFYILTATYTSSLSLKGQDSIILHIH
jgi:cytochrome c